MRADNDHHGDVAFSQFAGNDDLDKAQRWVDDWETGLAERARQARALAGRLADVSATARSDDGLVEVTVNSGGLITGLFLDERVRAQSAASTAEQIMTVVHKAHQQLTNQVTNATAETLGAETEAGKAVIASFANRFATSGGGPHAAR